RRQMDVLEDENGRLSLRERLDQSPCREEERLPVADPAFPPDADQHRDVRRRLAVVTVYELAYRTVDLRGCSIDRIRVEDADDLLHESREGAVRRHLAVRKRATADDKRVHASDLGELRRQPRLPDARGTKDRHELRPALRQHTSPDSFECGELAL